MRKTILKNLAVFAIGLIFILTLLNFASSPINTIAMIFGATSPEYGKIILTDSFEKEQIYTLKRLGRVPDEIKLKPRTHYIVVDDDIVFRANGFVVDDDIVFNTPRIVIDDDIVFLNLDQTSNIKDTTTLYPVSRGQALVWERMERDSCENLIVKVFNKNIYGEPNLRFNRENSYVFINEDTLTIFGNLIKKDRSVELGIWEFPLKELKGLYKTSPVDKSAVIVEKELWIYKR